MNDQRPAGSGAGSAAHPPAPDREMPAEWYELATADHFWMSWRLRVCRRLLHDAGLGADRRLTGLEIGCGRGLLQRQLADATGWTIDGCDLNREALAENDSSTGRAVFYDVHERRPDLEEAYDFLVLFDVLEHIDRTDAFLESALFHLRPGGFVLVNVPALMALYSDYDRVVGHLRRYRRRTLAVELTATPALELVEMRYWGLTMLPMLLARKAVTALQSRPEAIMSTGFRPPGRLFSAAMRLVMRCETALTSRPVLGTSLMALARKPAGRAAGRDQSM